MMNLIVALDQRFESTPDRKVWTPGPFSHSFWHRYLEAFDHVRVVARVRQVATPAPGWVEADGPGVSFVPMTYYRGPWQYFKCRRSISADLRGVVGPSDSVILRVGSHVAGCLERELCRSGHPYGVEVVNDPYDAFSPGAIVLPLSPFFRWWFPRELRRQCARACAAAYVTELALQRRYPPAGGVFSTSYSSVEMTEVAYVTRTGGAFSTHFSDVELSEAAFLPVHRNNRCARSSFRPVAVGSLEHLYKAPDVLREAIHRCVRDGIDLKLVWVGGGKHQPQIEARAQALGLGTRVQFPGSDARRRGGARGDGPSRCLRHAIQTGGATPGDDRGHGARSALHRIDCWGHPRVAGDRGPRAAGRCLGAGDEDPRGRQRPGADGPDVGPEPGESRRISRRGSPRAARRILPPHPRGDRSLVVFVGISHGFARCHPTAWGVLG